MTWLVMANPEKVKYQIATVLNDSKTGSRVPKALFKVSNPCKIDVLLFQCSSVRWIVPEYQFLKQSGHATYVELPMK